MLTVEPDIAASVLASLARSKLATIPVSETLMTGLNCGTLPCSPDRTCVTAWARRWDVALDEADSQAGRNDLRAAAQ